MDNGQPSIRILNRRGPEIQDWCNHDVLNYNSRLVGIPDEWQGPGALTEALDQRGLSWDDYLLPGLTDLHLGAANDHLAMVARLASDGYQLK